MHEMSIATGLIEQVLKIANENRLPHIDEVEIEAGQLRFIVPEAMYAAFEAVSEGTIAQGAKLKITEVKAMARCRKCNKKYAPKIDDFLCPSCSVADFEIVQGDDIILKSLIYNEDKKGNIVK